MTENPVTPEPEEGIPPQPVAETPAPAQPSVRTVEGLEHLTLQFLLAKATELAAGGNYAEAETCLAAIPNGRKHAPLLDLLARIRAQQGRPAEAVELWQMAVQMDPANAEYRAGLAFVEKAAKSPFHPTRLPGLLLRLLAGLLVLGLFIAVLVRLGSLERRLAALTPASPAVASQPTVDLSSISNRLDSLESGQMDIQTDMDNANSGITDTQLSFQNFQFNFDNVFNSINSRLTNLDSEQLKLSNKIDKLQTIDSLVELKLDITGLIVTSEGDNWIITPESGLFQYSWLLADDAKPLLEQLARQLAPWAGQTQLELVGYAAEDERDPNFNLGMIRAVLISDVLSSAGLPEEMIRIRPAAGRPAPFDNDSFSGRAANRTVIFILHRWPQ
jgi:hypothetical protein